MSTLSNNSIAEAIYLASKDKTSPELNAISKEVVKFLNRRHLLGKSDAILSQLEKIVNLKTNTIKANVFSPKILSEKIKTELIHFLKHRYKAHEIIIKEKLDEKLLGGFRIEVNDEVIDLTLKNKISKLKEYLIKD